MFEYFLEIPEFHFGCHYSLKTEAASQKLCLNSRQFLICFDKHLSKMAKIILNFTSAHFLSDCFYERNHFHGG